MKAPTRTLLLPAASLLSGALLFLSDYPVHAWPVQAVAFVPFLLAILIGRPTIRAAALSGALLGGAYVIPMAAAIGLPPLMSALLSMYEALLFVGLAVVLRSVLRLRAPWSPLLAGAAAAAMEWINVTVVPVWGTSQSYARVWSAAPLAIQVVSVTGFTGVVFLLVSSQASLARTLAGPDRRRSGVTLAALLAGACVLNGILWSQAFDRRIRVAAIGWTASDTARRGAVFTQQRLERLYEPLLEEAARGGAKLVVSPEVGFRLLLEEKAAVLGRLSGLARRHGAMLAVGYFDQARNDNRIAFFGPDGTVLDEYVKTHLIHGAENYRAGDGSLVEHDLEGSRVGGMICQDDNFTDLSRGYARKAVQVLAVPTNDWRAVKDYHFEACRFRPVESRYGIVRAASNGISAIVSPRGEVLARRDHFAEGAGVIVADLPVSEGGSLYGRFGDWFPILCGAALALTLLLRRRRP